MKEDVITYQGFSVRVISAAAAVVGTGAAGYRAALELYDNNVRDTVIITEGKNCGTSRNTGSDKQTYYKLSLCGDANDSPAEMAQDLFGGGCVDGDTALAEAANSAACFLKLCSLGVPFPVDRFGQYAGYKTDHDPRARATSTGPLTSKMMTEALEAAVAIKNIPVLDNLLVISVIKNKDGTAGLLALDKSATADINRRFVLIHCANIVFATGGPACVYTDSVYPDSHTGSSGVLAEAGISFQNMTEWQYGLASVNPKWNVSGTYMQVLPRFVSVDADGKERYFLEEFYGFPECLNKTFLKGYEWPFDSKKLPDGSSRIDLLVYIENVFYNRKVYLDFRSNPFGDKNIAYGNLGKEASEYLEACGACFGTPLERLLHMNRPAYELYLNKGVDIAKEMLEVAVCAQHHNGGASVDAWWQTSLKGLFAAGEAAGTHGIRRPGGSALNAGQVGALRAARYISRNLRPNMDLSAFKKAAQNEVVKNYTLCNSAISGQSNAAGISVRLQNEMSEIAGIVRNAEELHSALKHSLDLIKDFDKNIKINSFSGLPQLYKLKDNLFARTLLLFALIDYTGRGGKSRGSAVYPALKVSKSIDDLLRFEYDDASLKNKVQEVSFSENGLQSLWRDVRPLPQTTDSFENIWRAYRENGNIF